MREILSTLAVYSLIWLSPAFAAPDACQRGYRVLGVSSEEEKLIAEFEGSFYKIKKKSSEDTAKDNRRALEELKALPLVAKRGSRNGALNDVEVEELFEKVMAMPEVKNSICGTYKKSAKFGFCFGRALAVHLKALQAGVDKRSIRKIWAVGNLRMSGNKWNYHVATIVRGEEGKWWALDPVFGKPLPLEDWYLKVRQESDPDGTARIYSTVASRLFPYRADQYKTKELMRPLFKDFFKDLLERVRIDQGR